MHILANISRSKDNLTMTFGQLIEYDMRSIFLEKSYTKCGGKTSPRFCPKKSQLSISPDQQYKVLYSLFSLYLQVEDYQNILKLECRPLAFTSYKASLKMIFEEKYFSLYVPLIDHILLSDYLYFLRCWLICVF